MDIQFDFGVSGRIDAINAMLDAIGSVGINSEEEIDWNIDAADADKLLSRYSQAIQSNRGKGWWFNREEFHELDPDPVNGYVVVPTNTIACYIKRRDGKPLPVTFRDGKLFDTKSYGYDMRQMTNNAGKIPCILVMNLPFDSLPATAMQAITDAAAFWMQNNKEGDPNKMQNLANAAKDSMVSMQVEDASQKKRNLLNNPYNARQMHYIGGYNNVG